MSQQTVSNAVNDLDDQMGAETRERVVADSARLDYHRNPSAHRLRSPHRDTIGFLILDEAKRFLADPMTDLFLAGFGDVLRDHDCSLLIQASKPDWPLEQLILPLLAGRIDGAVLLLSGTTAQRRRYADRLRGLDEPLVLLQEHRRIGVPAVVADDRRASAALCQHLIGRGHERIAFLTATHRWSAIEERHAGYRSALRGAGLEPDPVLSRWAGGFDAVEACAEAGRLLALEAPPTAIMCGNDLIALGAMKAARERGLRIPEDVAITGFDDFDFAAAVEPALTTVAIPGYEMGRHAAHSLIAAPDAGALQGTAFRAELKLRASG